MLHDRPFNYIFENGIVCGGTSTFVIATFSGAVTCSSTLSVSGQASFADGTAAAPSVKVGDEQNGLYSPAANQLGIALNGSLKYTLASGNIGAGVGLSAWGSGYNVVELGAAGMALVGHTSANAVGLVSNAYQDSGNNWKYSSTSTAVFYQQYAAAHTFYGAASGTAGNTITWTQVLAVQKGYAVTLEGASPQTGTGITFPATQSASSNANTLDDYEEGTFTPTLTGDATNNHTYTTQSGVYVKVGQLVHVNIQITLNLKNGTTGNLYLAGLPFANTTDGTDVRTSGVVGYYGGLGGTADYGVRLFHTTENATSCYFVYVNAGLVGWASVTNSHAFYMSLTYRASA